LSNGIFTVSGSLPIAVAGHCLAPLGDGLYFMGTGTAGTQAFILSAPSGEVIQELQNLPLPDDGDLFGAACGYFESDGKHLIVVAGGYLGTLDQEDAQGTDAVYIYDLDDPNGLWLPGTPLPKPLFGFRAVQEQWVDDFETFIVVGGQEKQDQGEEEKNLYRFIMSGNQNTWEKAIPVESDLDEHNFLRFASFLPQVFELYY